MKLITNAILSLTAILIIVLLATSCAAPKPIVTTAPTVTEIEEVASPEPVDADRPAEEQEEWDLVWISDSSGMLTAELYAEMVAEDTGRKINLTDLWVGGLEAREVLDSLQGIYDRHDSRFEKMPVALAEAELIVFYANPSGSIYDPRPGDWECTPSDHYYVNDCDPEIFITYLEHLKEIYRLIFELRGGQPTIIRAFDAYNPLINQFREAGVYEDCKTCWGYYNAAIHQAAEAYNIPVAGVAEAWNGPDWDLDPEDDLGYVASDHIHPSLLGRQATAQAIRELGYEPVQP